MLCGPSWLYFLISFSPVDCIFLQTACWRRTVLGTAISSLVNLKKKVFAAWNHFSRWVEWLTYLPGLICIAANIFFFLNIFRCINSISPSRPILVNLLQDSADKAESPACKRTNKFQVICNLHVIVTPRWFFGNNALSERCDYYHGQCQAEEKLVFWPIALPTIPAY